MVPLTTLYDEYFGRSKLTEQKNSFKYIAPPPSRGVGTKMECFYKQCKVATLNFRTNQKYSHEKKNMSNMQFCVKTRYQVSLTNVRASPDVRGQEMGNDLPNFK